MSNSFTSFITTITTLMKYEKSLLERVSKTRQARIRSVHRESEGTLFSTLVSLFSGRLTGRLIGDDLDSPDLITYLNPADLLTRLCPVSASSGPVVELVILGG